MKKNFILLLISLFIITYSYAQSIKIVYNGSILANNATIDTNGTINELFSIPFGLKNVTNSTVQIKVKKIIHYAVSGSDVSFCFAGNCFDPSIFVSPTTAVINKDSTDISFLADYCANGHQGSTSVTYLFYNLNTSGDTAKVKINFNTMTGIETISKSDIYFSDAYPNPASTSATISYSLPKATKTSSIRISNILGSKVAEYAILDLNGKKILDLNEFTQGVYFYSLIVNDKIYFTRKLVVK